MTDYLIMIAHINHQITYGLNNFYPTSQYSLSLFIVSFFIFILLILCMPREYVLMIRVSSTLISIMFFY